MENSIRAIGPVVTLLVIDVAASRRTASRAEPAGAASVATA